jgi:hypothetical protein
MIATELINRAYYLSGIVARGLEEVAGDKGADGLFWLNSLLEEKSIDGKLISDYQHQSQTMIVGQQKYFVPNLVVIDSADFVLGVVRYSMEKDERVRFWGEPRALNIESLPYKYYFERITGGANIYVWPLPSSAFILEYTGKFQLSEVTPDTDLDPLLYKFYQTFLCYELAIRLCDWFKVSPPSNTYIQYEKFNKSLQGLNVMDFSIIKQSTLSKGYLLDWNQINLGRGGFSPP